MLFLICIKDHISVTIYSSYMLSANEWSVILSSRLSYALFSQELATFLHGSMPDHTTPIKSTHSLMYHHDTRDFSQLTAPSKLFIDWCTCL